MDSAPRKIWRLPARCPMTKMNKTAPVPAIRYFLPRDEQNRLRRRLVIKFSAGPSISVILMMVPGPSISKVRYKNALAAREVRLLADQEKGLICHVRFGRAEAAHPGNPPCAHRRNPQTRCHQRAR